MAANNRVESGKVITATAKAGRKELEKYKNALEKQMKKENSLFLFKSNKFRTAQEKKLGKRFESSVEADQNMEKRPEFPLKVKPQKKEVSEMEKTKASSCSKVNRFGKIVKKGPQLLVNSVTSVSIRNDEIKKDVEKSEDFALPSVKDGHLCPKNCNSNVKERIEYFDNEKLRDVTRSSRSSDKVKELEKPVLILDTAMDVNDIGLMNRNSEKKNCEKLEHDITEEEETKVGNTLTNSEANNDLEKVRQNSRKSFGLPEISVNKLVDAPKQVKRRKHGSKRKRGGSSKSGSSRTLVKSSSLPDVRRKSSEDVPKHPTVQRSIAKPTEMPSNRGKNCPKKEPKRAVADCRNVPVVIVPRKPSDVMPNGSEVKAGWSVVYRVVRMKRRFVKRKGQSTLTARDSDGISNPVEDVAVKETVTQVWESLKNCRYLRVVSHAQT